MKRISSFAVPLCFFIVTMSSAQAALLGQTPSTSSDLHASQLPWHQQIRYFGSIDADHLQFDRNITVSDGTFSMKTDFNGQVNSSRLNLSASGELWRGFPMRLSLSYIRLQDHANMNIPDIDVENFLAYYDSTRDEARLDFNLTYLYSPGIQFGTNIGSGLYRDDRTDYFQFDDPLSTPRTIIWWGDIFADGMIFSSELFASSNHRWGNFELNLLGSLNLAFDLFGEKAYLSDNVAASQEYMINADGERESLIAYVDSAIQYHWTPNLLSAVNLQYINSNLSSSRQEDDDGESVEWESEQDENSDMLLMALNMKYAFSQHLLFALSYEKLLFYQGRIPYDDESPLPITQKFNLDYDMISLNMVYNFGGKTSKRRMRNNRLMKTKRMFNPNRDRK